MFPTIAHFLNYVFGTSFNWPIPTFGFFVVLAFVLSFLVFRSEFKRKEKSGEIKAFIPANKNNRQEGLLQILGFGILGFLIGFKGYALFLEPDLIQRDPFIFLISSTGNLSVGIILSFLMMGISSVILYNNNKSTLQTPLIRPHELSPLMLLYCAIAGFVGSKIFNILEDWDMLQAYGFVEMLKRSGLTFYGGLVFGAIAYFIIGIRNGISWKPLADIGALGMLVAYSVGRMGCHFSGDGDWGIVNLQPKPFPWMPDQLWGFKFPHNVIERGIPIPGCEGKYCFMLAEPVFPTSAYEVILIGASFLILWSIRNRITMPGLMTCIYFFIISIERFFIETIRVNYKFDVLGIPLSEAQIISVFLFFIALTLAIYLRVTYLYQKKLK